MGPSRTASKGADPGTWLALVPPVPVSGILNLGD